MSFYGPKVTLEWKYRLGTVGKLIVSCDDTFVALSEEGAKNTFMLPPVMARTLADKLNAAADMADKFNVLKQIVLEAARVGDAAWFGIKEDE